MGRRSGDDRLGGGAREGLARRGTHLLDGIMEQRGEEVDEDTDAIRVDVCRSSQFSFEDVPSAIEGLRDMTFFRRNIKK